MSFIYRLWQRRLMRLTERRMPSSRAKISCAGPLLLMSLLMAACSMGGSGGGGNATTVTGGGSGGDVALTSLHWCGTPSQLFRDQASAQSGENTSQSQLGPADGKPRTVTDWNVVKANLGFTLYLPTTMPAGSCLLSVSSSLRDPVFGSNFTITYVLPDHSAVSFSQAPVRNQHISAFQCNVSQDSSATSNNGKATSGATPTAQSNSSMQLCTGVRDKTSIVFSAHGQTSTLQQMFQNLQPNVNWMPAK